MKPSLVDSFPGGGEIHSNPIETYFAQVALRQSAELQSDANASIVAHAQEVLKPQLAAEILAPQEEIVSSFKHVLEQSTPNLQFTEAGPSVFWVFQRRGQLADGGTHTIQTCVELVAPYMTLDPETSADMPAIQQVVTFGIQPDHDILGVSRQPRLGLGKLFGFKPYEPGDLASSMAHQLLSKHDSQISIYTSVDHGDGNVQTLGRFRFNHAQHVARKMQFLDSANAGQLAKGILEESHELSTAGAEAYLKAHIGWSIPSDYGHIRKVTQIVSESQLITDNEQCIAPIFAYEPAQS